MQKQLEESQLYYNRAAILVRLVGEVLPGIKLEGALGMCAQSFSTQMTVTAYLVILFPSNPSFTYTMTITF